MSDNIINSIQDLLKKLEDYQKTESTVWYRGQASSNWSLLPFYKRMTDVPSESTLLKQFKQSASMLVDSSTKGDFEWLFLMQHYGVPTRLLDWSESPLVALYFAVDNYENHKDEDAALWLLNPSELNKNANIHNEEEKEFIPSFDDEELKSYTVSSLSTTNRIKLFPVATIATRNNPRIQAQLGVFTIHHNDDIPIEEIGDKKHVTKFIIPSKSRKYIKDQLAILGFTKFQLFPELSSIGDIIKGKII